MDQLDALGNAVKKLSATIDSLDQPLDSEKNPEYVANVVKTFRNKVGQELEFWTNKLEAMNTDITAISLSSTKSRDDLRRLELAFKQKEAHLMQYGFKPTERHLPSYPEFVSSSSQLPTIPEPPSTKAPDLSVPPIPVSQTSAAMSAPTLEMLVSRYAKPVSAPSTTQGVKPPVTNGERTYTVMAEKELCPAKELMISRYATPKKRALEREMEEKQEREEEEKAQKARIIARYSIAQAAPKLPTQTATSTNIDDLLSRYPAKHGPKEFVPLSAPRSSMLPGEDLLERTAMMLNSPLSPVSKTAPVAFDDNTPIRFNIGPQDDGHSTPPQRPGPSIQTSTPAPWTRRKKMDLDVVQTPIRLTAKREVEKNPSPSKRAKDSPPAKENRDPGLAIDSTTPELTKPMAIKPEIVKPPAAVLDPTHASEKPSASKPNLESLLAKYRTC